MTISTRTKLSPSQKIRELSAGPIRVYSLCHDDDDDDGRFNYYHKLQDTGITKKITRKQYTRSTDIDSQYQ